jgi:hypothetical protein
MAQLLVNVRPSWFGPAVPLAAGWWSRFVDALMRALAGGHL